MIKETNFSDKIRNPNTRIYLPELFEEINNKDRDAQIILIKQYIGKSKENASRLRDFLQCVYHPSVNLDLPETVPPYDNTQYVDYDFAPLTLEKALSRVKYFVKGHSAYIENKIKREHLFIQTLESLHKKDSRLMEAVLLKQFPIDVYPNLGISVFSECVDYLPDDGPIDVKEIIKHEQWLRETSKNTLTNVKK